MAMLVDLAQFAVEGTRRSLYYRKYILQITQPSQYRYTQLQYTFAVISEAPSMHPFRYAHIETPIRTPYVLNTLF